MKKLIVFLSILAIFTVNSLSMAVSHIDIEDGKHHVIDHDNFEDTIIHIDNFTGNEPGTHIDLVDGGLVWSIYASHTSTVNMSGGRIIEHLVAYANSTITVTGGKVEKIYATMGNGILYLKGTNFSANGIKLANGDKLSSFGTLVERTTNGISFDYLKGTFKGTLEDGTVLNNRFEVHNLGRYDGSTGDIIIVCEVPIELEVTGPETIKERSTQQYTATAYYDNGTSRDVTDSVNWSIEPANYGSINTSGVLIADGVDAAEHLTVYASYIEGDVSLVSEKVVLVEPFTAPPGKVYWSEFGANNIMRSNLDGSEVEDIVSAGLNGPTGLHLDLANERIYWASFLDGSIKRANLHGTELINLVDGLSRPTNLALDLEGGKIYWSELGNKNISRANLDGTNIEELVSGLGSPRGIALDLTGEKMYWADTSLYQINRANLDGSDVELVINTSTMYPYGLELDETNGKIYWTGYEQLNFKNTYIKRANLDGSEIEIIKDNGMDTPIDLSLDMTNSMMYWVDYGTNTLHSANLDGTDTVTLHSGLSSPWGIDLIIDQTEPTALEISGPDELTEDSQGQYTAVAVYDDGSAVDVTDLVEWSLTPNEFAAIDSSGLVTCGGVDHEGTFAVIARYVEGDTVIEADKSISYLPLIDSYYVDGIYGSNNNDGLSIETAFATIQFAIDVADNADSIFVLPDVYNENIIFEGKAITVSGFAGLPIIDGDGYWGVSFFDGEGHDTVLKNMMVTNSYMGIFIAGSSPTILNVNVIGNMFGIEAYNEAEPDIVNCILWENSEDDLFGCQARYSCIERIEQSIGISNISEPPLFVNPGDGNYRLLSEFGRYEPNLDLWVCDQVTSACINAGDPAIDPQDETEPNGGRINIGAYGGTTEASRGPWALRGDINRDGIVNLADFAIMAENWLEELQWMQ